MVDSKPLPVSPPPTPTPTPTPTSTPSSTLAAKPAPLGAYRVWPADAEGNCIELDKPANPAAPRAVEIYFGVLPRTTPPPKDQGDLQAEIGQVLTTIKTLYISRDGVVAPPFRLYYARLFRIAQLGLEGDAVPDMAKNSLDRVVDDLIDAEGARVKNRHLAVLGGRAAALAAGFLALYVAMCALPPGILLPALGVDPPMGKSFMLLWIGCCVGVWLSYAIRTTALTLRDLVVEDADRLLPLTRLLFAGLLTMTLGLMLALGFVDLKVGQLSFAEFYHHPTLALLLGLFCGVSELLLPSMIGKRAGEVFSKVQ